MSIEFQFDAELNLIFLCLLYIFPAPKVYKSTGDYVTGLYNPQMASRCVKKDAGTCMHYEQRLDLTEK